MSHYIYRKKLFAETSSGLLLPFACCSDSSLTVGSGMNEHHPSFWCVMNLGFDYLFPQKEVWEKAVNAEYDRQIALLQEYERNYPSGKPCERVSPETQQRHCITGTNQTGIFSWL